MKQNKFSKALLLIIPTLIMASCSNEVELSIVNDNTVNTFAFVPTSIENSTLGNIKDYTLKVGEQIGKTNGYQSEAKVINEALNLQKGIFNPNKDYIVTNTGNNFYLYNIDAYNKSQKTNFSFASYDETRAFKTTFNIFAIVTKKGNVRYLSPQASTKVYSLAKTPEEVVVRLKTMETEFTRTQDHRGIFATTYRVITQRAIKALNDYKKEGNLKAADFEEKLLLDFANTYFIAYDNYSSNNFSKTTEVWRAAFDSGRKAQSIDLKKSGSIAEILALSMTAHIVHDLSFTLHRIGYDEKDIVIKDTFFKFNKDLFEEKDNILSALKSNYGNNIIQQANNFFGPVGEFTMQKIFSAMRGLAAEQSNNYNPDKIVKTSLGISNGVMKLVPGGNSIKN